jgi:uncharacterized phiE125 gp8 family phage protein
LAVTTLAEYKVFTGISGTGDDAALTVMIALAQDLAEKHCGRLFDSSARTQVYDGMGTKVLQVNAYPITAVSSITVEDAEGDVYWTLATTEYKIDANAGIITLTPKNGPTIDGDDSYWWGASTFPSDAQNINIVYTGGYTTAPDSLKYAVWMITNYLFANRRADTAVASESIGHYSVTYANAAGELRTGGALGTAAYLLSEYRRGGL